MNWLIKYCPTIRGSKLLSRFQRLVNWYIVLNWLRKNVLTRVLLNSTIIFFEINCLTGIVVKLARFVSEDLGCLYLLIRSHSLLNLTFYFDIIAMLTQKRFFQHNALNILISFTIRPKITFCVLFWAHWFWVWLVWFESILMRLLFYNFQFLFWRLILFLY